MGYFEREIRQIAALPLLAKPDGSLDLCIVTARGSGRWIIPKGNPIHGLQPHEVAAREALEEAGLVGVAHPDCIGSFKFDRRQTRCTVDVYAMKVSWQNPQWAEMNDRSVLCCNVETALSMISPKGLVDLISRYLHSGQTRQTAQVPEYQLGFA